MKGIKHKHNLKYSDSVYDYIHRSGSCVPSHIAVGDLVGLICHSRPPIFFTNFIPFGPRLLAVSYHVKFTCTQQPYATKKSRRPHRSGEDPISRWLQECRTSRVRCDTAKPLCTLPGERTAMHEESGFKMGIELSRSGLGRVGNKTGASQPTHGSLSSEMHVVPSAHYRS